MPGSDLARKYAANCYNNSKCILDFIHWGRVGDLFLSKWVIIGSGNGLSPVRRQAIAWTYDALQLIAQLRKKSVYIQENVSENVVCKMLAILSRP